MFTHDKSSCRLSEPFTGRPAYQAQMAKLKAAWNGHPCPSDAKAIVDQIRNAQAASAAKARAASKVKSKAKLHVGAKTKLPLPTTLPSRDALRKQVTAFLYVSV